MLLHQKQYLKKEYRVPYLLDGNMVDHMSERSNEKIERCGGSNKSLRSPAEQLYYESSSFNYSSINTNNMLMMKKRNSGSRLSSRQFYISSCGDYSSRFKVSMMIVVLVWCCCFLNTIVGFQFSDSRPCIIKNRQTIIQVNSSCSRRHSFSRIQATKHEHIIDDSGEDGSRNSNSNSHTNKDDMVNVQKRAMTFKRRMKALSAKFLDDNGLELVMERKTGIITARPKEQTTTTAYAAASTGTTHAAEAHHHHHHNDSSSSSSSSATSTAIPTTVLDDVLHGTVKKSKAPLKTISAKYLDDNGLELVRDIETGAISAQPVGRYDFDEEDGQTTPKYQPIVFSIDKHDKPTVNNDVDISTFQKPSTSTTASSATSESNSSSKTLKDSISNSLASSKRKGIERAIASIEKTKEGRHNEHTSTHSAEERTSTTNNKTKKKKKTNFITKMPKIIDNSAKRAAARAASQQQQQQQVLGGVVVGAAGLVDETEYYKNDDQESSTTTILDDPQQQQQQQHLNKPKITSTRLREKHKRKIKAGIIATPLKEHTPKVNDVINPTKQAFNVVLTHCTADFDSLASAVGLAKLWSSEEGSQLLDMTSIKASSTSRSKISDNDQDGLEQQSQQEEQTIMSSDVPTYVVLPRGAHPAVARFLGLHKHLFPIRSLKSLPHDLSSLNRLGLVDAQRRDRVGPAEPLLGMAKRVTILDHHIDGESDIPEASDYVVEQVGSVSTMVVERIQRANVELSEAEATLLALGIHADTGSLCFDSTTPRDAMALAYCMQAGASQPAIAEHAQSSLSEEQNSVLTQALLNTNSTLVHGVTVTTVLLSSEGFINGLAAVAQDVLELTSSGVLIFAVVYDPKARSSSSNRSSSSSTSTKKQANSKHKNPLASAAIVNDIDPSQHPSTQQLRHAAAQQQQASAMVPPPGATGAGNNNNVSNKIKHNLELAHDHGTTVSDEDIIMFTEAWKGGEQALKRRRLQAAFTKKDIDGSGYLERQELSAALSASGVIASKDTLDEILNEIDSDGDGKVNYDEFEAFAELVEERQKQLEKVSGKRSSTMIMIGRVKTGINVKSVNLNTLFQPYGGGGHAKAASATVRLEDSNEAEGILQNVVDELIETSLLEQPTVGEFMTSPVLSAKPTMTETQVEDLFSRYDVRALPVVDDDNNVIGLVTYKEVAAAKQRLWNKQQKHLERERKEKEKEQQRKLKEQQQQANENSNNTTMADSNVGGNNNSTDESTIRNSERRNSNREGRANNNYANKDDVAQERQRGEKIRRERRQSLGSALKGWMKQHVRVVEASTTLTEAEEMLLENDVGCIPVVADGTKQLVGMVTRTDILRQHRYYPSLHYHNKGFSDSIEARKPIIELRKRLKKFDLENE